MNTFIFIFVAAVFLLITAAPLVYAASSNQTKDIRTCYTTVINTMSLTNPSLKILLKIPPIQSFKDSVIQNLTKPVHSMMFGQENTAGDMLVKQTADCVRLMEK